MPTTTNILTILDQMTTSHSTRNSPSARDMVTIVSTRVVAVTLAMLASASCRPYQRVLTIGAMSGGIAYRSQQGTTERDVALRNSAIATAGGLLVWTLLEKAASNTSAELLFEVVVGGAAITGGLAYEYGKSHDKEDPIAYGSKWAGLGGGAGFLLGGGALMMRPRSSSETYASSASSNDSDDDSSGYSSTSDSTTSSQSSSSTSSSSSSDGSGSSIELSSSQSVAPPAPAPAPAPPPPKPKPKESTLQDCKGDSCCEYWWRESHGLNKPGTAQQVRC